MRRTRSTVLAVVAVGALVFAACGGDDEESIDAKDSTAETTADDTTDDTTEESTNETTEETTSDEEMSPLAEQFAEGFASSAGFELAPEENECMVDGLLDEFEMSELVELGQSSDAPDAETMSRVGSVMDDCISTDALVTLFEGQGLDTETATCLVDGIVEEGYQISDIVEVGLDSTSEEAQAFQETVGNLAVSCGAGA